jgi:hypothetical protein
MFGIASMSNANKPTLMLIALALTVQAFATSSSDQQFVYSGFSGANITMDGAAAITHAGLLELTNGTQQLKGHAFHGTPLRFRRSRNGTVQSFVVSFVFGIISAFTDVSRRAQQGVLHRAPKPVHGPLQ